MKEEDFNFLKGVIAMIIEEAYVLVEEELDKDQVIIDGWKSENYFGFSITTKELLNSKEERYGGCIGKKINKVTKKITPFFPVDMIRMGEDWSMIPDHEIEKLIG